MPRPGRRVIAISFISIAIVACLAIGATAFLRYAFLRPYTSKGLLQQWQADGTLDRVRTWTHRQLADGGKLSPRLRDLPPVSGGPRVVALRVLHDRADQPCAVEFEFGGAENHHGLIVGDGPGTDAVWPVRETWADGVWWYDETPYADRAIRLQGK